MKNLLFLFLITPAFLITPVQADDQVDSYLDLGLEDLLSMEVTSVSRKKQRLSEAAAAVFVITQEDIRRSGATSIPEALRMAPGLQVARIDSNKWAITSRGFNGRFANKLLVLMDGRSVYTPTFAGVYWEVQDYLMEDIERIEVIRGPGATLWGANAVNGVINIITKHADETIGALVTASIGDEEKGAVGVRFGTKLGETSTGRGYFKAFSRDNYVDANGSDFDDDWGMMQGGFKVDSHVSADDSVAFQGDYYRGDIAQSVVSASMAAPYRTIYRDEVDVSGGNLLGRWQHTASSTSQFTFQSYFDWTERDEGYADQSNRTFDVDFQHQITLGKHDLIWGLGYRFISMKFDGGFNVSATPSEKREDDLYSFFVQDEIVLVEDLLKLIVGSKFEHNDYSGTEIQPSVRFVWMPAENHAVWGSVSRAARTPARLDHGLNVTAMVVPPFTPTNPTPVPAVATITHNSDFDSEEVWAWELGYRVKPAKNLSFDLAFFYNDYDQLRNITLETPVFQDTHVLQPLLIRNDIKGSTYGIEVASIWQPSEWWQWNLAYSYLVSDFDADTPVDGAWTSLAPRHQLSLRSLIDLSENVSLDLWFRYVDRHQMTDGFTLSLQEIDSYTTLDARLAWRLERNIELSLVGQNLFDSQHPEAVAELFTLSSEIERSVFAKIKWSF